MLATIMLLAENQGEGQQNPMGSLFFFFTMGAIFLVFFFVVLLPEKRKQKQHRQWLEKSLKKNDEVLTNAGIIGIVASIKDKEDEVVLKIDDSSNARLRVLKSTIIKILTPKEGSEPK